MSTIPFIFFGSSRFSVYVLDELKKLGFIPAAIVTTPDKPQGRKLILTPNIVKTWAVNNGVRVMDPAKLDESFIAELKSESVETYIVASYGKIMPAKLIEMPRRKTLNIHPSLLPEYRGASPLQAAILNDTKQTGITIMCIDEQMDHGPIVAQKSIDIATTFGEWPTYEVFEEFMAREGAKLLADTLPGWISGSIFEKEQNHGAATYTKKTKKEDGLIDFAADPYFNFRKIQAYHEWPQAYFIHSKDGKEMRVKVTSASFRDGALIIEKVIPEGGKEMDYTDFQRGYGDIVNRK